MRGFDFFGNTKVSLSPGVFVVRGGVTESFGILRLLLRAVLAS